MKFIHTLILLLFTVMSSWAQQVSINPSSVTLTKQGTVTIIVSGQLVAAYEYGNTGRTTPPVHVTVGTVQATYSFATGTSMSELGIVSGLISSSAGTGILNAGTYSVASDATVPVQITVILWNESAGSQGINLSEIELVYNSASAADQAAFQAFIVSLVQQQLSNLQSQITTQQNQIAELQQSSSENSSAISMLQENLGTLIANFDSLYSSLGTINSRLDALEAQLANITVTNGQNGSNGSNGSNGRNADTTLTYIGVGLGAAGFIGSVVNFFTGGGNSDDTSSSDAPGSQEGSEK